MKYSYNADSHWSNFKAWVRDTWREFIDGIPDRHKGEGCIILGLVWLFMLVPYGWEMISAFGALMVLGCGADILEKHYRAELVAARMDKDNP